MACPLVLAPQAGSRRVPEQGGASAGAGNGLVYARARHRWHGTGAEGCRRTEFSRGNRRRQVLSPTLSRQIFPEYSAPLVSQYFTASRLYRRIFPLWGCALPQRSTVGQERTQFVQAFFLVASIDQDRKVLEQACCTVAIHRRRPLAVEWRPSWILKISVSSPCCVPSRLNH
jgi:hypothetical protein